jgi:hypothetical protein
MPNDIFDFSCAMANDVERTRINAIDKILFFIF